MMNCLVNYSESSGEEEQDPHLSALELDSNSLKRGTDETACESKSTASRSKKAKTDSSIGIASETILEVETRSKSNSMVSRTKLSGESSLPRSQSPRNLHLELEPVQVEVQPNKNKRRKTKAEADDDSGDLPPLKLKSTNRHKTEECRNTWALPSAIHSMFGGHTDRRQWIDNPEQHGHRVRSFPHVEGNWATHVFVPVPKDERFVHFVSKLIGLFDGLPMEMQPEFHVSLSRTVAIRHHWIDPLVHSLKEGLTPLHSCVGDLVDVRIYANDDRTRSFLCIEVSKDDTNFADYVSVVDRCFQEFNLPIYYQDPSFHISVAWCLGDIRQSVTPEMLVKAKNLLETFCESNPELSVVFAQTIGCQSGNKSFVIPLVL